MNIFEQAVRRKLRFTSAVGKIGVEDLFDLPLTAGSRATRDVKMDLDTVSRSALSELNQFGETASLVNPAPKAGKEDAELRVEILKQIITEKQAAAEKARERAAKAERRRLVMEQIARKDQQDLEGKSKEELLKELAELDD